MSHNSVVKTKIKGYFSRKAISIRENCNFPGQMLGHSGRNRREENVWAQEIRHWQLHMQISLKEEKPGRHLGNAAQWHCF